MAKERVSAETSPVEDERPMQNDPYALPDLGDTLFVQNIFDGPLHVSDIGLSLEPHECYELSLSDHNKEVVAKSRNFKQAVYKGYLIILDEKQYQQALQHEMWLQMQGDMQQDQPGVQRGRDIALDTETGERVGRQREQKQMSPEEMIYNLDQMNSPYAIAMRYREAQKQGINPYAFSEQMKQDVSGGRMGQRMSSMRGQVYDPLRDTQSRPTYMDPYSTGSDPRNVMTVGRRTPMVNVRRGGASAGYDSDDFVDQVDMTDEFRG